MSDPSSSSPPPSSSTSLPQFPIELTDADATLQVHAMVPPALDTEQELCDDDLVVDEGASDSIIVEVTAPESRLPLPQRAAVPIPRPPPTPTHRRSMPSSIGPMALDLAPPTLTPPSRRRADSTVLLPRVANNHEKRMLVLVAAAAALAVVGLGSLGMTVAYSSHVRTSAASRAPTAAIATSTDAAGPRIAAPKEKELLATISVLATPDPTTTNANANVNVTTSANVTTNANVNAATTSTSPSHATTTSTSTPPTLTSVAAGAPASGPRTGVLRVPPSIHGLLVDGKPRRVDGSTVVTCGRHAIKTGIAPSRVVEIPCGGTAWL